MTTSTREMKDRRRARNAQLRLLPALDETGDTDIDRAKTLHLLGEATSIDGSRSRMARRIAGPVSVWVILAYP